MMLLMHAVVTLIKSVVNHSRIGHRPRDINTNSPKLRKDAIQHTPPSFISSVTPDVYFSFVLALEIKGDLL